MLWRNKRPTAAGVDPAQWCFCGELLFRVFAKRACIACTPELVRQARIGALARVSNSVRRSRAENDAILERAESLAKSRHIERLVEIYS